MSDFWIYSLAAWSCPLLALVGVYCLIAGKGAARRRLAWTAAVFLGSGALLAGGNFVLHFLGLTWRSLPSAILFGAWIISGWVGILFMLGCFLPMEWPKRSTAFRRTVKGVILALSALVLVITLWFGPLLLIFVYGEMDRVIEYRGQTLVEVDDGFLDMHYSYYAYHGPLVRGKERIYDGPTRIYGDIG